MPRYKLFLLYKTVWGDFDEGASRHIFAMTRTTTIENAKFDFGLMGFDLISGFFSIEEIEPFDDGTVMENCFKMPEELLPY